MKAAQEPGVTVSVAIVNHDYGRYLDACLSSVLDQDRPPDQVMVVDDGSTDESHEVLQRWSDRVSVVLQANSGQTAATNVALAACTGDVVAMLDSDDLAVPGRWARLAQVYDEHPEVRWCFHAVERVDRETLLPVETHERLVAFTEGHHDHRDAVMAGRLPVTLPPTSGLSWRRTFLDGLVPTPVPLKSQDNYLKFLSLGLGTGWVIAEPLSRMGLHGTNMYSTMTGRTRSTYAMANALQMQDGLRRHGLVRLADRFLAEAVVDSGFTRSMSPTDRAASLGHARAAGFPLVMALAPALARAGRRSWRRVIAAGRAGRRT